MSKKQTFIMTTLILGVVFMAIIPYTVINVKSSSEELQENVIKTSAKEEAKRMANAIKVMRSKYTKNVIGVAKQVCSVTHDYTDSKWIGAEKPAIPLPATLSMEIAKGLSKEGTDVQLYSKYPFPWRDKGGSSERKLTEFQSRAWDDFVEKHDGETTSNLEFFEFDDERRVLNYAIPDLMVNTTCVSCHNTRAGSPKTDWQLGDVRGSISIQLPLAKNEAVAAQIDDNTADTRNMLIVMAFVGLLIFLVVYLSNKEQAKEIEQINEMAVNDLKMQEDAFDTQLKAKNAQINELSAQLAT